MCGDGCSGTVPVVHTSGTEECRYDKGNCEYKCTVNRFTEAPTTTASQEINSINYNFYFLATASQEIISINLIILLFNNLI